MSSNLDPTESDSFVLDGSSDDKSKFLCFYVSTNWQIKDYVYETFTVEHKTLWIKVVGYYALEGVMTPTIIIPHYQIGQMKNVRGRVNTQVCVQWHLLSNAFNCRDNHTIRSTQRE